MPFTISHAAAVLPLSRTPLPLAALMIGSMAPDFAYFLPKGPGVLSHSVPGLYEFCWPAGLLVWLVFVQLLESPTLALLPDRWRRLFRRSDHAWTAKNFALASVAVVLGAASHVLWDGFTHANAPVVEWLPFLETTSVEFFGKQFPLFRFLQHLSTVIGLVALIAWVARLKNSDQAGADDSPPVVAATTGERVFALLLVLGLSAVLGFGGYFEVPELSFGRRLFHGAIGGMTGAALAWVASAAFMQVRFRARPGNARGE
jgi:hypothetical protein